jgi:ribonuclease R
MPLVTIDGEDARDFDDAVYCEPAKVGRAKGWRLLVAIADVSHYVQTGSAIDVDAYDRATSVYFPRRVIPMLPEKLSNGLCSLNPEVERLCMVCDMLITAKGEVHAYQFYPAVMFSHARFTYTEVAAILANTRGPEAAKRRSGFPTCSTCTTCTAHSCWPGASAARSISRPPRRRSSATRTAASKKSFRARATTRTS